MSGQLVGQIANREVKETLADTGPVFVQETFETWLTMWYTLQKASSTVTEFSDWIADVNAEGLQMLSQIRGYGRICYFHFDGFPAPSSWESIAARLLPGMTPQQRTAAFSEMTYEVLHFVCDKLQTISKALVTIAVAKSRTKKTQWTKLQKWVMKDGKVKTGDDTHLSNINQWLYTEGTVEKKTLDLYLVEIEKIATALKTHDTEAANTEAADTEAATWKSLVERTLNNARLYNTQMAKARSTHLALVAKEIVGKEPDIVAVAGMLRKVDKMLQVPLSQREQEKQEIAMAMQSLVMSEEKGDE